MTRISLMLFAGALALCAVAPADAGPDSCGVVLGPGIGTGRTAFHQNYDLTLSADTLYYLTGLYYVDSTYSITIPAGTVVRADTAATLIIKRGARIYATGTAADPVVFTSMKPAGQRARGDWGGIIILGEAPVNQVNPLIEGGIIEGTYGGTNPNDSNGIFRYVRIEYCGYRYQLNNEVNGLTMGGVGDGTEIHHVQVSYSFDDSYEWFGGTVNCSHLVALGGTDDDFDTDFGYQGRVQFGFGLKDPNMWDPTGETNGFESDNEGTAPYLSNPKTHPVFSNITLVGPERVDSIVGNLPVGHKFQYGALIRRASLTSVFNSCVMGFPWGYSLRDDSTKQWANLDLLKMRNTNFQASAIPTGSTHIHDENRWKVTDAITPGILAWVNMPGYSNQDSPMVPGAVSLPSYIQLADMDDFNNPDPRPLPTSPLVTLGTNFAYTELTHPFFTPVTYRGAFDPALPMDQQWTAGWTNFNPQGEVYYASVEPTEEPATRVFFTQSRPNPFRGTTVIRYIVPSAGRVSLKVFDVQGQQVANLVDGTKQPGTYETTFETDATASGVYFYRYSGRGFDETRKLVLTK